MFPTRWLSVLPLGLALMLGSCARHPYTGVRSVALDQLNRGDGKRLFDALRVHCWQVDLPAVSGEQYVVVKLDLQLDGKPGLIEEPRIRSHDRHAIVAVTENGQNQVWSIITSTGNSDINWVEPTPLPSSVRTSSTIFDQGDRQSGGTVRLAHWEYADTGGKQIKTVDAVVTVEKRIGEGVGRIVP